MTEPHQNGKGQVNLWRLRWGTVCKLKSSTFILENCSKKRLPGKRHECSWCRTHVACYHRHHHHMKYSRSGCYGKLLKISSCCDEKRNVANWDKVRLMVQLEVGIGIWEKTLTLGLEVRQRGASWTVCTESGTPERRLSAGCERNGQRCGVPVGPQHPETEEESLFYLLCKQHIHIKKRKATALICLALKCFWVGTLPYWLRLVAELQMCPCVQRLESRVTQVSPFCSSGIYLSVSVAQQS